MDDFQVGDEVFCLLNGEGVVTKITPGMIYPVIVDFGRGFSVSYNDDGYLESSAITPCLYHKGTVVTIKPALPKRYPWVNIYSDNNGNCFVGVNYMSKICALESTESRILGYRYVDTIQLKPKGEQ